MPVRRHPDSHRHHPGWRAPMRNSSLPLATGTMAHLAGVQMLRLQHVPASQQVAVRISSSSLIKDNRIPSCYSLVTD